VERDLRSASRAERARVELCLEVATPDQHVGGDVPRSTSYVVHQDAVPEKGGVSRLETPYGIGGE